MYIYEYQMLELNYDEQNNILTIIGFPVTESWIIKIIIPIFSGFLGTI